MRIKMLNKDFLAALNNVGKIISSKPIEPILSNILLKAENDKISLVSTNLEQGIKNTVEAKVELQEGEPKETVLPFNLTREIIAKLNPDKETELSISEMKGIIKQDNSVYHLTCFDPDAFALLPKIEEKVKIIVPKNTLKKLIENTVFAASKKEESRKEFKGVLFNASNNTLEFAATDSTCLAISSLEAPDITESSFIIPWRALDVLNKVEIKDKTINIVSDKNQISFNSSNINIISLLINGTFPPYKSVIPKENEFVAEVNKKELLDALNRIEILVKNSTQRINITFSKGRMEIEAVLPEIGEGKENIKFNGSVELSIIFNGERLISGVSHVPDETVVFKMNGPLHPVIIKGKNDDSYLFVTMPLKKSKVT